MLFDLRLPEELADKEPEDGRLYRKFDYGRLAKRPTTNTQNDYISAASAAVSEGKSDVRGAMESSVITVEKVL